MYSRPPSPMGRFPRGVRVPENYSGNAFTSEKPQEPEPQEEQKREPPVIEASSEAIEESDPSKKKEEKRPAFKFDIGRFFSGNRGFGMEDFLIIALVLLLAQNDTDDDTLIFLILLLFIR